MARIFRSDSRIICDVYECQYCSPENRCTAKRIHVKPRNSLTRDDNDCVTFTPRNIRI
ncbi:MAG: DUF1540 domain-containing protein [Clostridia bacterium]|jgi:hypothetical protein|nr:DUF1540 domain-containing protein [Clostridiaceae bacterium]